MTRSSTTIKRLPWQSWNLTRNPFGELTREERVQLAVVDWRKLLAEAEAPWNRFPQPQLAWQFIAPCGYGKSTRLLAAQAHFPGSHYVYVTPERTCESIPDADLLLIDEVDRMPIRLWRRILKTQKPLILGTHRDLSRSLRWFGYQSRTRPLALENGPNHLCEVMNRRIESCRLSSSRPVPKLTPLDAEQLLKRFGGDFRAIEQNLYEHLQSPPLKESDGPLRIVDPTG